MPFAPLIAILPNLFAFLLPPSPDPPNGTIQLGLDWTQLPFLISRSKGECFKFQEGDSKFANANKKRKSLKITHKGLNQKLKDLTLKIC